MANHRPARPTAKTPSSKPTFPVSPKTRSGLNCTLSYLTGSGKKAVSHSYKVRCSGLSYGYQQIATESQSRLQRAFYPRQVVPTQFMLVIDIVGQQERTSFNNYIMGYVNTLATNSTGAATAMTVTLPASNFKRSGVPLKGWAWGTRIGAINYRMTLLFEIAGEPGDGGLGDISSVQSTLAAVVSPSTRYFYPTGDQLLGDQQPTIGVGANGDPVTAAILGSTTPPKKTPKQPLPNGPVPRGPLSGILYYNEPGTK